MFPGSTHPEQENDCFIMNTLEIINLVVNYEEVYPSDTFLSQLLQSFPANIHFLIFKTVRV